jgi:hypothetical protein
LKGTGGDCNFEIVHLLWNFLDEPAEGNVIEKANLINLITDDLVTRLIEHWFIHKDQKENGVDHLR